MTNTTTTMGEVFRKVRVLHTFILQRITDSEDVEGRVEMQGTFVQRVLDLTKEEAEAFCNQENSTAFFEYRFNQQVATEGNVRVRRVDREVVFEVDEKGKPKLDENGKNSIACHGCRTTMKVRIPLQVELVASAFPFEISRLDATIELRSIVLNGKRIRGDLLLHDSDPRHTICMGLGLGLDGLLENYGLRVAESRCEIQKALDTIDKTKGYSLISPYPEVCYTNNDTKMVNYCTRFTLTFFAVNAGFQKLVAIVLPMILVTFLAILNVMNDVWASCESESDDCVEGEEVTNHLEVTSALTLTIIFVLPQVVDNDSYRLKFKLMTREAISIMVFFLSLVLASVPRRLSLSHSASTEIVGVTLMALSTFLVPLHNFYIYFGFRNNIYNTAKRSLRTNQFLLDDTHRRWKGFHGLKGFFTLDDFFQQKGMIPRKNLYTVFGGYKEDCCLWWDKNFEKKETLIA